MEKERDTLSSQHDKEVKELQDKIKKEIDAMLKEKDKKIDDLAVEVVGLQAKLKAAAASAHRSSQEAGMKNL